MTKWLSKLRKLITKETCTGHGGDNGWLGGGVGESRPLKNLLPYSRQEMMVAMEIQRSSCLYNTFRCKIVSIWKWIEYVKEGGVINTSLGQMLVPFSEIRDTRRKH